MLRVEDFFEVRAATEGDVWRLDVVGELDLAAAQRRAKTLRKDPWEGFAKLRQSLPRFDANAWPLA